MDHSARNNQQVSGEKGMALLSSELDGEYDEEEDYDDGEVKEEELATVTNDDDDEDAEFDDDIYNKVEEMELTTVTNSLCERKMNLTLHPGQMCAGEEGRDHCSARWRWRRRWRWRHEIVVQFYRTSYRSNLWRLGIFLLMENVRMIKIRLTTFTETKLLDVV